MLLILVIAAVLFVYLKYMREDVYEVKLLTDLDEPVPTGSQKAIRPYFFSAVILFIIQIALGAITGHYTVEGNYFFGILLANIIPYAVART